MKTKWQDLCYADTSRMSKAERYGWWFVGFSMAFGLVVLVFV